MKPFPIIGTAQFGFPYGITNESGQVPFDDVIEILNFSYSHHVKKSIGHASSIHTATLSDVIIIGASIEILFLPDRAIIYLFTLS